MVIKSTNPLQVNKGISALRLANFSRASNGESFSLNWASVPGKTRSKPANPCSPINGPTSAIP